MEHLHGYKEVWWIRLEHLSSTGTFVSLLIILHISACISEQIISAVMTTNCLPHEWSELIWPNADGVMSILMVILESLITYHERPAGFSPNCPRPYLAAAAS
jgi:hypothetical protein